MLITTATSTDEAKRGATVALLPVGSFEQHGDHLPLTTDTLVGCVIANQLAITYNLFLLPPITMWLFCRSRGWLDHDRLGRNAVS
jgi:creatinine amidohydrolase